MSTLPRFLSVYEFSRQPRCARCLLADTAHVFPEARRETPADIYVRKTRSGYATKATLTLTSGTRSRGACLHQSGRFRAPLCPAPFAAATTAAAAAVAAVVIVVATAVDVSSDHHYHHHQAASVCFTELRMHPRQNAQPV
ncbi:uncharacterized protein LOC105423341 [Pogonomyrmex barbatus]|uniref:Uncharacterized protein LOC105423341 n=1 Tax=Pogonomyrmex barbatus TaxID=144034 RepID=A0A6I9VWJ3_9HYME|nr:uncharacterized protein LOC105423341 [Pogonomyrmex barbatus]